MTQILGTLLTKRYLVLFLFVAIVISTSSFPTDLLKPFITPTPEILPPSKRVLSNTLPLVEKWRWSGKVDEAVLTEDNIVIIGRKGSKQSIIVFDAHTGNLLWQSEPIANIRSITADESRVYIGAITYVQAFDLEVGQKLWRGAEQPDMKKGGFKVHIKENQVEAYDILEPVVYILDAAIGQTIEEISKNLFFRWNDINYSIVRGNYLLEAKDANSDERLWSYAFPGYIHGWPVFADDIMLQNARGQIFGIEAKTGEVVWQTTEPQTAFMHPQYVSSVALQDNIAYALRYDAAIVGFNPETGEQIGIIEIMPDQTLEDDKGEVKYYGIATSDKFVVVYYGNSQDLIVFEKL